MIRAPFECNRGVGAVLLAAGESSRMEEPKQLLEWRGLPLLQYQIRELQRAAVQELVVVLGYRADEFLPLFDRVVDPARTHVVVNPHYHEGKTTSIRAGLMSLSGSASAVLLLAVDQPRPARVLRELIASHLRAESPISIPTSRGRRGHPPLFHRSLLPELLAITEEGQGIREVLRRHRESIHEVEVNTSLVLTNLNSPEDYRRAREGAV